MTYAQQAEIATKLQIALNDGEYNGNYIVDYDSCESGLTRCYYKGVLYKEALNDEMVPFMDIIPFVAPTELKFCIELGF